MKILYVITGLSQGGAERVVCDLADSMFTKGYEVKIAYLTGELLTMPVNQDIELIKINLNNIYSLPKAYLKLSKLIISYKPHIVHSHMVHANLLTRLIRLTVPIDKLISTAHNSNEGGRIRMVLYRVTHKLSDVTTNVSREATLAFENKKAVPKGGMSTVYNGIDTKVFIYNPNARNQLISELHINYNYKIILAVGRFSDQKDYPNLLKAIYLLKKEIKQPFKLIIAGDGELRALIEDLIRELDLVQDVILLGRRNDIANLMSSADLFVLASKYEGFGLVVAEAMMCKCLVVATDSGGVAEVIDNAQFLVPTGDSVTLATKMLQSLALEKDEYKEIILRNFNYIQNNFSLDLIAKRWVKIYYEK